MSILHKAKTFFISLSFIKYGLFFLWASLIIISVLIPDGVERVSIFAAKLEFIVHVLTILSLVFILKKHEIEKRPFVGLFWISIWLFLVDLFFYIAVYSSKSYLLSTTIAQFFLYYAPCIVYAVMMILFIVKFLIRNGLKFKGLIKILILALILNFIVLGLFINSLRNYVDLSQWENIAQVCLITVEFFLFGLSIVGLIYANNYAIFYLLLGNIALVIGDFFLTYSSLFKTISVFAYGELFWLLGLLMIFFSVLQIINNRAYSVGDWFYKDNTVRSRLAIWGMGSSIIGFLIFLTCAYMFSILDNKIFLSLPLFVMSYSIIAVFTSKIMGRNFDIPFKQLNANIQHLLVDDPRNEINSDFAMSEFIFINNVISEAFSAIKEKEKNRKSLADFTAQVAHDIRSPLTAIDILTAKLHSLIPESERLMLRNASRRIDDIALSLVRRYKGQVTIQTGNSVIFLFLAVSEIAAEKRLEHSGKGISIEVQVEGDYTHFSVTYGNAIEFKRMVSNLINNSISALDSKGYIRLLLSNSNGSFCMKIIDNGYGISEENLNAILSYKTEGVLPVCGLGLPHAMNYLKNIGGSLEINSTLGVGTELKILIPQIEPPEWLCSEIMFREDCILIIVDDDQSIHDAWSQKIQQIVTVEPKLKLEVIHLYSPEECTCWFEENDNSNVVLFSDYEFLNSNENGLGLLKSISRPIVHKKLVTSHYENQEIIQALNDGIKLLPKQLVSMITFNILPKNTADIDLVFIDDQDLNIKTWERLAKIKKIKLATYSSTNAFWKDKESFSLSTPIYVDQDFGEGNETGIEFTKRLSSIGYINLYLATGYILEEHYDWLKGITSKRPPFA